MIVNRDLNSLSINKNLKSNAQGNHPQLKRSYTNQSDTFQSNKCSTKDMSFGALIKRPLLQRILSGGTSFPELQSEWAVEAALDLAKKTEKMIPKLKKTAKNLEKIAQKEIKKANISKDESLKITEASPATIKEAKETATELKIKSKKIVKKPKSAEEEAEEKAKEIILTKKDKKRLSKAIAAKVGIEPNKETIKAIKSIIDAKIARTEAENAQKAVPGLKEEAKKLEDAFNEEILKEMKEESNLRKARLSKISKTCQSIKNTISNLFSSKKNT